MLLQGKILVGKDYSSCIENNRASYQHDEPSHHEPLKPVWLATMQPGAHESTAPAVKTSHLLLS